MLTNLWLRILLKGYNSTSNIPRKVEANIILW